MNSVLWNTFYWQIICSWEISSLSDICVFIWERKTSLFLPEKFYLNILDTIASFESVFLLCFFFHLYRRSVFPQMMPRCWRNRNSYSCSDSLILRLPIVLWERCYENVMNRNRTLCDSVNSEICYCGNCLKWRMKWQWVFVPLHLICRNILLFFKFTPIKISSGWVNILGHFILI